MKTEGVPGPAEEGSRNEHKATLKERATHELKEFLGMFIYLWVLFALFVIRESIILAQQHLNYQAQGFAILNAFILAKVMLIAEDLHLGSDLPPERSKLTAAFHHLEIQLTNYLFSLVTGDERIVSRQRSPL